MPRNKATFRHGQPGFNVATSRLIDCNLNAGVLGPSLSINSRPFHRGLSSPRLSVRGSHATYVQTTAQATRLTKSRCICRRGGTSTTQFRFPVWYLRISIRSNNNALPSLSPTPRIQHSVSMVQTQRNEIQQHGGIENTALQNARPRRRSELTDRKEVTTMSRMSAERRVD